ncbi:hypothetical protein [Aureimonas sp. SK2]|uniref:hypothetical protein n=1 Tax=Aureimonas sp. SK2 TaxID=3015992 RepID=UPI0024444C6F|nr:hypothetical protein [Aureimonas sp. SK2]
MEIGDGDISTASTTSRQRVEVDVEAVEVDVEAIEVDVEVDLSTPTRRGRRRRVEARKRLDEGSTIARHHRRR